MGAIDKEARIRGNSLGVAFQELQDEDREENGTDTYSGGWNNSDGVREVSASEFKNTDIADMDKWGNAIAVCIKKPIKNSNKVKTKVKAFPNVGARVWETIYVVRLNSFKESFTGLSDKSQTQAIKKARAYVEKHPETSAYIEITKVLTKGVSKVAEIEYKKSNNERGGIWDIKGVVPY